MWFFFDVETKDISAWDARIKIIKRFRKLRKRLGIKVCLLMTTGCLEYWLMLHYKMYAPSIQIVAEKNRVMADLLDKEPHYKKGDIDIISKIALQYLTAVKNAKKTVSNLLSVGLPCLEDTDERNRWLCKNCPTFSNVYEAFDFLLALKSKSGH